MELEEDGHTAERDLSDGPEERGQRSETRVTLENGASPAVLDDFGEKRVRDTPISENTIVGAGVGAAMLGLRPVVERMRGLAPDGFRFTAKLTRTLTHEVDPNAWRGQAALYRDGVAPIVQSGQLSAVLLQFPPAFTRSTSIPARFATVVVRLAQALPAWPGVEPGRPSQAS